MRKHRFCHIIAVAMLISIIISLAGCAAPTEPLQPVDLSGKQKPLLDDFKNQYFTLAKDH